MMFHRWWNIFRWILVRNCIQFQYFSDKACLVAVPTEMKTANFSSCWIELWVISFAETNPLSKSGFIFRWIRKLVHWEQWVGRTVRNSTCRCVPGFFGWWFFVRRCGIFFWSIVYIGRYRNLLKTWSWFMRFCCFWYWVRNFKSLPFGLWLFC